MLNLNVYIVWFLKLDSWKAGHRRMFLNCFAALRGSWAFDLSLSTGHQSHVHSATANTASTASDLCLCLTVSTGWKAETNRPCIHVLATSQWRSIKHVCKSNERDHPTPPQTCRSIDHASTCKQHRSGVASSMCAKAMNAIIPPTPPTPLQMCHNKKH